MNSAALYVHDGLADWEAGFILPELAKASFEIKTIAESQQAVKTMGGLTVLPDFKIADVDWRSISILILPGGLSWMNQDLNQQIVKLLPMLNERGITLAGICGATVPLARTGLLNNIRHTSNYLQFLKEAAPNYTGDKLYCNKLAVCDGNIITASGIGAIEFSYEIIKVLNVYDGQKAKDWYEFFKNGVVPAFMLKQ